MKTYPCSIISKHWFCIHKIEFRISFFSDSKQHSNEKVENCLRFFLLQDISRKAMRMKFDKIVTPSDFSQTFDEFRNNCKEEKRKNSQYIKSISFYKNTLIFVDCLTWTNIILPFFLPISLTLIASVHLFDSQM